MSCLSSKLDTPSLTLLILNHKDLERTKTIVLEGLGLFRELGHLSGIALCLSQLSHRVIWGGDFSPPVPWLEEAKVIYDQLGDLGGEADMLNIQGSLAYWLGVGAFKRENRGRRPRFSCKEEKRNHLTG